MNGLSSMNGRISSGSWYHWHWKQPLRVLLFQSLVPTLISPEWGEICSVQKQPNPLLSLSFDDSKGTLAQYRPFEAKSSISCHFRVNFTPNRVKKGMLKNEDVYAARVWKVSGLKRDHWSWTKPFPRLSFNRIWFTQESLLFRRNRDSLSLPRPCREFEPGHHTMDEY